MKLNIQMFASASNNKNIYTSKYPSSYPYVLTVSFNESSTDTTNNYSNISLSTTLSANGIRFSDNTGGTLYLYWHDDKNNTDVVIGSKKITKCGKNSSGDYGTGSVSGTYQAYHKNDGTLNGHAKAVWDKQGTSTYMPNDNNVSTANTALTPIPRTSNISVTTTNIGSNPTITITKASSSYTHTLRYYFTSDVQGTIVTKTTASSYTSWTLPTSLYTKIPSQNSIVGTLYCDTYNGNSLIGTTSTSITANVPSNATPTVSAAALSDTISTPSGFTGFIKNKSKLIFNMSNSFSSQYSSPLNYFVISLNGSQIYSGSSTSYTMTTPISKTSNTYTLTAYDKRGKSSSITQTFTAYDYSNPNITKLEATRLSSPSTTIQVKFSGSITSLDSRNSKNFKIEYKATTSSSWTTATNYTASYSYTNQTYNITGLSDSLTYNIRVRATDFFASNELQTSIGTTFTLMNFNTEGTSLAFGKASEKNDTFEVNMNTEITGNLKVSSDIKIGNNSIFDLIYPVGSIYLSVNSTSPATLFGGSWSELGGRFLIGANSTYTAGTTGGSANTTLTEANLPQHTHTVTGVTGAAQWASGEIWFRGAGTSESGQATKTATTSGGNGTAKSFTNLPPYLAVYMWKRTA